MRNNINRIKLVFCLYDIVIIKQLVSLILSFIFSFLFELFRDF